MSLQQADLAVATLRPGDDGYDGYDAERRAVPAKVDALSSASRTGRAPILAHPPRAAAQLLAFAGSMLSTDQNQEGTDATVG